MKTERVFRCPCCASENFGSYENEDGKRVYCCHGGSVGPSIRGPCGWVGLMEDCFVPPDVTGAMRSLVDWLVERAAVGDHACLDGDCPHDKRSQCIEQLCKDWQETVG